LAEVLDRFGYRRHGANGANPRVFFHERHGLDLVAVDCAENWDQDCWKGEYRTTLALEVENRIQEFAMTMRGLLDARATLHCGIFYVPAKFEDRLGDTEVGMAAHKKDAITTQRLDDYVPPWRNSGHWAVVPSGDEQLLAVFLAENEPRVVGARCYRSGGETWSVPIARNQSGLP
jgi:hypothetical protein